MCIEMKKILPQVFFSGTAIKIAVRGLIGGHSGGEIHLYRGNSNQIMARILYQLGEKVSLISINGGSKHNAIPRECVAVVAVQDVEAAKKSIKETAAAIKGELGKDDKDFNVRVEEVSSPTNMGAEKESWQAICLLYTAPNGVFSMSHDIEGLVDASSNMGVVVTEGNAMQITFAPRASRESFNDDTESKLHLLGCTFGFEVETSSRYYSWPYSEISPLRNMVSSIYKEMTGGDMELKATHGGLECGILMNKVPGLDVVALGATLEGAHSPAERLNLPSANRVWLFLREVIRRLAK
jgi:dipeptidase D